MTVFPLPFRHGTVRAVRLCPFTDHHDTPVREQTLFLFRGTLPETEGNVFLIDSPQNGTCTVVAVFAPDFVRPVLTVGDGEGRVDSGGYPVEVTVTTNASPYQGEAYFCAESKRASPRSPTQRSARHKGKTPSGG